MAGLGQVQHRPSAAGGGRGRRDQDGAGPPARPAAPDPARRRALPPRRLVGGRGAPADRGRAVDRRPAPPPGGRVLVRDERHQRPPHPGRAPRRRPGRQGHPRAAGGRRDGVGDVRADRRRRPRPGGPAVRAPGRPARAGPGRRGLVAGGDPVGVRAPRGARRDQPRRADGRPAGPGAGHGGRGPGPGGVRVPRPGRPVGRHGPGARGLLAGVRGEARRVRPGPGPARRTGTSRT